MISRTRARLMGRRAALGAAAWLRDLAIMVLVLTAVQVGAVQAYHVPTGSMEPTIRAGDLVVADKLTLGPRTPHWVGIPGTDIGISVPAIKLPGLRPLERGDVVVVQVPVSERIPYMKRVVALAGDLVEIRDKALYVNGAPVPEPDGVRHVDPRRLRPGYRQAGIYQGLGNRDNWGPMEVPQGSVFLMGDNRDNSLDSRFFGPVEEERIIGRARLVALSWLSSESDRMPWERLRLDRAGAVVD